jgi:hypothetical protein
MPSYLYDVGNEVNGNYITTTLSQTITETFLQFNKFWIKPNHVVNLGSDDINRTYIILADSVIIEGTLNGRNILPGNSSSNQVSAGGAGGGGDFWNVSGSSPNGEGCGFNYSVFSSGLSINPPTFSTVISGGLGVPSMYQMPLKHGQSSSISILDAAKNIRPFLHGGNGGSGVFCSNSAVSNNGGRGGDGIYLICNYFQLTGIIDTRGGNGTISSPLGTNGGAGGGGSIIVSAQTVSNSGYILTEGGIANNQYTCGYYSFAGGNGGNGAFIIIDR